MSREGISEADVYATWGDLFEVAAKRGCMDLLLERGLLPEEKQLARWSELQVADLITHLNRQLGITDPATKARYARALQHLLVEGWAIGWTVLRGALDQLGGSGVNTRGLYCPLSLPVRPQAEADSRAHVAFWEALHLPGAPDPAWLQKGQPARADFFLWLQDREEHQHIFVLEFSLNARAEVQDYAEAETHLDRLLEHARRLESRGIFTRVGAMLTSEQFCFSDAIVSHLPALTTQDKPLYKLAQASAYATNFLRNLRERKYPIGAVTAHAIAITTNGVEALEAEYSEPTTPRWALMCAIGAAYPKVRRPEDDNPGRLNREIAAVRAEVVRALPESLQAAVEAGLDESSSGDQMRLRLSEQIADFVNPAAPIPWERLAEGIEETGEVAALLGVERPREALAKDLGGASLVTLREVHTAAIHRVIEHAPRGQITVLAAEGMPGIGKTYSVRTGLERLSEGFLWFYASPRLVINEDVLREMVKPKDGRAPNVVALTTNSRLIGGAAAWANDHQETGRRTVDSAVLHMGALLQVSPKGSTLFVDEQQAQEIDARYSGSGFKKHNLDEDTDEMRQARTNGVMKTLAGAARDVLDKNRDVSRLLLTASVQGFRQVAADDTRRSTRTTVDRLSGLFHERSGTPAGLAERLALGRRMPTVVVMVDEIAGDGAGAPFVHELGAWLHRELIAPFEHVPDSCPFRVILVLADASLGNDDVMTSYLDNEDSAPEKVLVSPSKGHIPFRVIARELRIGGRLYRALHMMADGFPAKNLRIDYRVRLNTLYPDDKDLGVPTAARRLIKEAEGESLHGVVQTIFNVLQDLPPDEQVIFFAQDKQRLREIQGALLNPGEAASDQLLPIETHGLQLEADRVAILDSSVSDKERKRLIEPSVRDEQRVFLMTSSGARGVSFPRASTIIALVPGFAVESGFMEIAQLVYRGRGGDGDHLDRRLIMLMQDFVLAHEAIDERQWLRRTLDLLSAVLLLRATILTRITGDAALPNQMAAVVPVGPIGADDVTAGLSQAVGPFLQDSGLYLRGGGDPSLKGLIENSRKAVADLFADFGQMARLPRGRASVVQPEFVDRLNSAISAENSWLVNRAQPRMLPPHVFAVGPLWLESWSGLEVEESISFGGHAEGYRQQVADLRARLFRIGEAHDCLPKPLTKAARDLSELLGRQKALRDRAFRVKRNMGDARLWVAVPIGYPAFMFVEGEHGAQVRPVEPDTQAIWRDALQRVVWAASPLLTMDPVIPRYQECPYITFQTNGDPTGLERAFDGRYFMASTELNLLNAILFV